MDDRSRRVSPSMLSIPDLQFDRSGGGSPLRLLHRGSKSPSPTLAATPPEREPFTYDAWTSMTPPAFDEPDVDQMAQNIMTRLLTDPLHDLPASYTSPVMRIIESHTKYRLENKRLQVAVEDAEQQNRVLERELIQAREKLLAHNIPLTPRDDLSPRANSMLSSERNAPFDPDRLIASLGSASPSTLRFPLRKSPTSPELPLALHSRKDHPSPSSVKPLETPDRSRNASSSSLAALRRLAILPIRERERESEQSAALKENSEVSPLKQAEPNLVGSLNSGPDDSIPVATKASSSASRPGLRAARPQERTFSFHWGDDSSFHHRPLKMHDGTSTGHGRAPSKSLPGVTQQSKQPLEQANAPKTASSAPKTISDSDVLHEVDSTPMPPGDSPPGASLSKSRIPSPTYQAASQTPLRPRRETNATIHTAIQHSSPVDPGASLLRGSFANVDEPSADQGSHSRRSK